MIMSEAVDQIAKALSAAQAEFEAVSKTADNPFFKSKYAPLPAVVAAASPILAAHGLAVWQGPDVLDGEDVLWTIVLHESGQYIGSAARLYLTKKDPQGQGSAMTYGRRYGYQAGTGLVADEDDDGNAASDPKPPGRQAKAPTRKAPAPKAPAPGKVSQETLTAIKTAFKASGMSTTEYAELLAGVGSPANTTDLTQEQAEWVLLKLTAPKAPEAA